MLESNPLKIKPTQETTLAAGQEKAGAQAVTETALALTKEVKTAATRKSLADLVELREKMAEDELIKTEMSLIDGDPELKELYTALIENFDFDRLREKSNIQLKALHQKYFAGISFFNFKERQKRREKLEAFEALIESLHPIRSDEAHYEEFLSPTLTGYASSYGQSDTMVRAEHFVYGSFSEIGHNMTRGQHGQRLDPKDIAPRAQIVMNDIINVRPRVKEGESFMKKYLTNMFDYETGKKILAIYLALVFDQPEQAREVLRTAAGELETAQRWDQLDRLRYVDQSVTPSLPEEYIQLREKNEALTKAFTARMKALLAEFGLEPPLSLEIRVKDKARIIKS